ncbi:hypothetical protein [Kineococcus rhizosphaerae]|uniref:Uncharacterized protein n=1 Tax=Kineococcus rhizosphaerae TaxID=559628 RepID=A0A2T0R7I2_9ACTN|nr:hypothetical protein [Kineococcus rhizosphaerae]PRY17128.1 hypothetical protein CLV37_10286 [Kineococcus rhizosphaerae]
MRIAVDPTAAQPAELLDRNEFTSFDVAVPAGSSVADLSAVLGPVGELDAEGEDVAAAHVRVSIEWLRRTAHAEGADAGWDEQFERMLAYAESKGWVADGTVRAHVVVD